MASISLAAVSGDCRFLQGAACCWGHAVHFTLILSTPIQFSTVTNLGLVSRPPDFKSVFKLYVSSRPSFLHAVKLSSQERRSGMCQADGTIFFFHHLPDILLYDSFTDKVADIATYFVFPIPSNWTCTESDISFSLAKGPC